MDRISSVYYRYATETDIRHNDIVMPNKNMHRFLRRLGIRLQPLEVAGLVGYLDPLDYGYVTLDAFMDLWNQKTESDNRVTEYRHTDVADTRTDVPIPTPHTTHSHSSVTN